MPGLVEKQAASSFYAACRAMGNCAPRGRFGACFPAYARRAESMPQNPRLWYILPKETKNYKSLPISNNSNRKTNNLLKSLFAAQAPCSARRERERRVHEAGAPGEKGPNMGEKRRKPRKAANFGESWELPGGKRASFVESFFQETTGFV